MCGITGITGIRDKDRAAAIISRMNKAIAHRGPDDSGFWLNEGIALAQRRLSIIDLSTAGHQPMLNASGNLVLVFNGEIYNFRELKATLSEYPFQTQTDTEVILAAYERWGRDCVKHFNGMFAFAIWNKSTEELFIARDRMGIKPLYYYQHESSLLFSSELRGLLQSGLVPKKLNREGVVDYLRYQTVHAPETIVEGVQMLMPGHYMVVKEGILSIREYWSLLDNKTGKNLQGKSYSQVKKDVYRLLQKAVERRLVADVPFGAFLSGGIDSSIIVGLMSQVASQNIKTFSVSFDEAEFSEAKYAQLIANKFKTDHTEIRLKPEAFLELIPNALHAMDHPSGDGPNTYVVSKVTKEAGITMALSGLGGDEVFAGYEVFKRIPLLQRYRWLAAIPSPLRKAAGQSLMEIKPSIATGKIAALLGLPDWELKNVYPLTRQVLDDKLIERLLIKNELSVNRVQQLIEGEALLRQGGDSVELLSRISVSEMQSYMLNTLLRDADQMSMAHALEVRVPFLDHTLVEYVLSLSDHFKRPLTPKKLLTDSVGELIPSEIIHRPKMGFTLPWQNWMHKELFDFCEDKMNKLAKREIFFEKEVLKLWKEFLIHKPSVSWSRIWYLVVLENWLEENGVA